MNKLMVAAGGTLLSLPFVAIFVGMVLDEGWLFALVISGIVALGLAITWTGIELIARGLTR